jgi:hypothetical protein
MSDTRNTPTIPLTPAVLRVLGEGCSRLDDGDLSDRAKADAVRSALARLGFEHAGYDFHPTETNRDKTLRAIAAAEYGLWGDAHNVFAVTGDGAVLIFSDDPQPAPFPFFELHELPPELDEVSSDIAGDHMEAVEAYATKAVK